MEAGHCGWTTTISKGEEGGGLENSKSRQFAQVISPLIMVCFVIQSTAFKSLLLKPELMLPFLCVNLSFI